VIDDDAGVMNALRDDLSRRFGRNFRVVAESSAAAGLAVLRGLADGHEPVALLIVDYHLSRMTGVGFLARAHAMHPLAKRSTEVAASDHPGCARQRRPEPFLRDYPHSHIVAGSGQGTLNRQRTADDR